jgi:predicted dehydrogenase
MVEPIRIAFTGTGFISRIHARAAKKLASVELVAVVNHRAESTIAYAVEFRIPRQYIMVEELLADGEIDALVICTPNALHAQQSIAALRNGIHVMVEKPMAINAVEAAHMLEASHESEAILMVAHCWRFDPEIRWLKQQAQSGKLGKIIRTRGSGVRVNFGPEGWFTHKALAGGGALFDMGIHAVDTARFLLDDPNPANVFARLGTYFGEYDVDDTGSLVITWENGISSVIESGWRQPFADGPEAFTRLYGTLGYGQVFPTLLSLRQDGEMISTDAGFPPFRAQHCPQSLYDQQMAYFIDCIRQHRTPVPGGEEGLVNMRILDAAYESSRTGRVINF